MTASTGVRENTAAVAKELSKAGIKVKPYGRNPIYGTPNTTFSISMTGDVVRLWAGAAKIKVLPEKSLKQAVLQVFEPARKIQTTAKLTYSDWDAFATLANAQRHMSEYGIRRKLNVNMPDGAVYSVVALDRKNVSEADRGSYNADYGTITVQGQVRATHQNFLVGKDEKSQFISALPRKAVSVKDAHEALRPAGVPRNALRQGEWFFVPATQAEKRAIKAEVEARGTRTPVQQFGGTYRARYEVGELENGSSHRAPAQITVNNRKYAVGVVYDDRQGHHGSLLLPDWHRVIRNREVVIAGQNNARWD